MANVRYPLPPTAWFDSRYDRLQTQIWDVIALCVHRSIQSQGNLAGHNPIWVLQEIPLWVQSGNPTSYLEKRSPTDNSKNISLNFIRICGFWGVWWQSEIGFEDKIFEKYFIILIFPRGWGYHSSLVDIFFGVYTGFGEHKEDRHYNSNCDEHSENVCISICTLWQQDFEFMRMVEGLEWVVGQGPSRLSRERTQETTACELIIQVKQHVVWKRC